MSTTSADTPCTASCRWWRLAGIAFVAAGVSAIAHADEFSWRYGFDGEFGDASNWIPQPGDPQVPGEEDIAIFDRSSFFTVSFLESHATDRVKLRAGFVTFALAETAGYSLLDDHFLSPGITIAENNGDIASLIVEGGVFEAVYTNIGHLADAFGTLTIQGSEASLVNEHQFNVASQGIGFFNLTDGATASNAAASVAQAGASFGFADVTGEGTMWCCDGALWIGLSGVGDLAITDGAAVSCFDAVIAQNRNSQGTVTVAGPETTWTIDGTLDVGLAGFGQLVIENGAAVTNSTLALVGGFPGGFDEVALGEVVIRHHDTTWLVDGDLFVGTPGVGRLSIGLGGRILVANDLRINSVDALFDIDPHTFVLGSSNDYPEAAINVGGELYSDDGPVAMTVELDDSYQPQAGDTFLLIGAAGGANLIDPSLPDLPDPLGWSLNQTETTVEITVTLSNGADINGDGVVDIADLLALLAAWGPCEGCPEDLDDSGFVDVADLLQVLAAWD